MLASGLFTCRWLQPAYARPWPLARWLTARLLLLPLNRARTLNLRRKRETQAARLLNKVGENFWGAERGLGRADTPIWRLSRMERQ
jgi:hypothetical protein